MVLPLRECAVLGYNLWVKNVANRRIMRRGIRTTAPAPPGTAGNLSRGAPWRICLPSDESLSAFSFLLRPDRREHTCGRCSASRWARVAQRSLLRLKFTALRVPSLPRRPRRSCPDLRGDRLRLLHVTHEPGFVLQNTKWPDTHPASESINGTGFSPSEYHRSLLAYSRRHFRLSREAALTLRCLRC